MAPGLLDMPKVVMIKIIEDIGIMFTLRKVCHDLRKFIDDIKPDAKLEQIWMNAKCNDGIVSIRYYFFARHHYATYVGDNEGCLVESSNRRNQILLKNEDFITIFMKDFEIVSSHQTSILKMFTLIGNLERDMNGIFFENLERILKSRDHPLKVETLTVECMDHNQLMSILPFLDAQTLNTLELRVWGLDLEVEELVKLNQWKSIKQMDLRNCCIDFEYIQYFTHFSTKFISFQSTHFPDLISLKDLFLQSPGFKIIEVSPSDYDHDDARQSMELLGKSLFEGEEEDGKRSRWFYRIPATTEILEISVYENCLKNQIYIKLSRIEEGEVPQEAVIQN